jgi:thiamine-monophosphate kinase
MFENKGVGDIKELGEFGLIDHLTQYVKIHHQDTVKGIGDDAAVLNNTHSQTLVSTDMLVEGVHFNLSYVPLKHLGYKSVVVNLSDIYAMGGKPKQITVSIAISSKFSIEAIEEFYKGVYIACNQYQVDIVGGDTTSSNLGMVISITAIGEAQIEDIIYRNGAKPNDLICVSGDLGSAFLGLHILEREMTIFKQNPEIQPDLVGFDYLIERQLKPEARRDIIEFLKEKKVKPSAMIDVSDGLASELHHLCKQSNTGCTIYEDKIPVDPLMYDTAIDLGLDPSTCALNGGEDYELLFTISMENYDKIKNSVLLSVIGHMTDVSNGLNFISKSNTVHPILAQGWNAFKNNSNEQ